MDLSAVIFVALAVAWAVYLVPKALKHHDEVASSRSVDRFSATMRTLARRDNVPATGGRVVVTPGRPASTARVSTKPSSAAARDPLAGLTPAQRRSRREAARVAARRRRRVLGVLLVPVAVVAVLAGIGTLSWWWVAAPVGVVVAWLVLCRVMVRGERARRLAAAPVLAGDEPVEADEVAVHGDDVPSSYDVLRTDDGFDEVAPEAVTSTLDPLGSGEVDEDLWEPRPVTLPTYVGKDVAPLMHAKLMYKNERGVWTSGHDTSDSIVAQTARDAEQEARASQPAVSTASAESTRDEDEGYSDRAVGS